MSITYGKPRPTNRVPKSPDNVAMIRAQDRMTVDKAIFDNQTSPWKKATKSIMGGGTIGMMRRSMAGKK